MYLIIDAGNTSTKVAVFKNEELISLNFLSSSEIEKLKTIVSSLGICATLVSSVLSNTETEKIVEIVPHALLLLNLQIPLKNKYKSKETLGTDRIANAVAINSKAKGNKLAIDIGTCIKFDFVNEKEEYLGGSISPGINLRYRAMNDYTGNLPLMDKKNSSNILGQNTIDCMHSGVINGIRGELDYFIKQYEDRYPDLTIFMTGGDSKYFDYSSKNNIFALENLTIEGLFLILKANAK